MNRTLVDRLVNAVLYEGYILYPYRPSVKNRQRWTFGGLFPEAWCQARQTGDASSNQTECLVHGGSETTFNAAVRFLHLTHRQIGEVIQPLGQPLVGAEPAFTPVAKLRVGNDSFHTWQEAEEREVALGEIALGELAASPRSRRFSFPGGRRWEPLAKSSGEMDGILVREQQPLEGVIEATAALVEEGLYRVTLRVVNRTPLEDAASCERDAALLRSLVSTHAVLGVRQGEFVSLLEPPECWREAVATCRNVGVWPVLVGEEGQKDTVLSSPIVLYDYPQVAPESPGDFFDATEIDEMLTLRILTLTDEEKQAMAAVDDRTGALLARTEALAREHLLGLHGTVRGMRPSTEEAEHG
jgi:hydrogenase maturation protease